MDCLEDKVPKGYSYLKRSHRYIKVFVPVRVLGKNEAIEDRIVQLIGRVLDSGKEGVGFQGFSDSLGKDAHKAGV